MNNMQIAAAVALALGTSVAAQAATLSGTACSGASVKLYVAGSSAAQSSFGSAIGADLFDGVNNTTFKAPAVSGSANGNFQAFCGTAKAGNGAGVATGATVLIHYRGEGGSVVGALPVAKGKPVKFLDLSPATCQSTAPSVTGLSSSVGTTDGWGGCVTTHAIEMGVTDLEPTVFVPPNYPGLYSTTVFGSASLTDLAALTTTPLFGQVFGIFVNTLGINGATTPQPIDLSRQAVANILVGNYTNWSQVPTSTGGFVSSTSQAITLVNREAGSGTRTGASIYFLETNCSGNGLNGGIINDPNPIGDGFATGDVLATAAATHGAITYASIDNNTKQANLTVASLSGVVPTNTAALNGGYDWWFEATAVTGAASATGSGVFNWLIGGELQNLATAPLARDILAIPNVGTNATGNPIPSRASGGVTIYINPFSRGGVSCAAPAAT